MPRKATRKPARSPRRKSAASGRRRIPPFIYKLGGLGAVLVVVVLAYFIWDMPGAEDVKPLEAKPSITVQSFDGKVIARYGGIKGDTVDVKDLPSYVPAAVLAIEDRRFYQHFGIDVLGLARAFFVNLMAGHYVQGGSTITQQLAKNLFLTPDKTIRRKVQEALLAIRIDWQFDKDDILSAYLNRVYFGNGAYGIDAAARVYFGKPATDLTLFESAVLAGLLKAPSRYSPTANPDLAKQRAETVIQAMHDAGYLDEKKTEATIKSARIKVAGGDQGDLTRYFADWIIDQLDDYVSNVTTDLVVHTTFDGSYQVAAEKNMRAVLMGLGGKDSKDDKKKDKKDAAKKNAKSDFPADAPQAALVTMGEDGAVLAMIGGRDYGESQFNRATQALRQPGSSFKTFVMLAALEQGLTPDTQVLDAPFIDGDYRPTNHEGKYYGNVTLTDTLALSLNTAAIRTLQAVGMPAMMSVLKRMPFHQDFRPELAIGLGAGETTLFDLTAAYAEIANGGFHIEPYAILDIKTGDGKVLYRHPAQNFTRQFSGANIATLDGMLQQVVARGTAQAAQLSRGHVAGKTGTSQNYRDAWFIGYSDDLVTGVWLGRDDSTPMPRVAGGGAPARWWKGYMNQAIDMSVPGFVTSFGRASAGFLGFGTGGPESGGTQWYSTTGGTPVQADQANPPQPAPPPPEQDSGFSSLLNYWSSTSNDNDSGPRIKPDTSAPKYNR